MRMKKTKRLSVKKKRFHNSAISEVRSSGTTFDHRRHISNTTFKHPIYFSKTNKDLPKTNLSRRLIKTLLLFIILSFADTFHMRKSVVFF